MFAANFSDKVQYKTGKLDWTNSISFPEDSAYLDVDASGTIDVRGIDFIQIRLLANGKGAVKQTNPCNNEYIHSGHGYGTSRPKFTCTKDRGHQGKHFGRQGGLSAEWENTK